MTQPNSDHDPGIRGLIEENILAIHQLVNLLNSLPAECYRQSFGVKKPQIIGKHVRHIIDHYTALLSASSRPGALLDYENRHRELVLETDRRAGRDRLMGIAQQLQDQWREGCEGELAMLHNSAGAQQVVSTSVERELVFLASHTIHHMAIIGMLAEQAGMEVSSDFGVHPSTLRYLEKQAEGLARSA
jgi:uncharacterized damage-inducible protein DinB